MAISGVDGVEMAKPKYSPFARLTPAVEVREPDAAMAPVVLAALRAVQSAVDPDTAGD
jgi:hypothetical protein